jgi:hypothetical protein
LTRLNCQNQPFLSDKIQYKTFSPKLFDWSHFQKLAKEFLVLRPADVSLALRNCLLDMEQEVVKIVVLYCLLQAFLAFLEPIALFSVSYALFSSPCFWPYFLRSFTVSTTTRIKLVSQN